MTAPHLDARLESAIHAAVTFGVGVGVDALAGVAAGLFPVTDDLKKVVAGTGISAVEAGIRHALAALGVSPRVDVLASEKAVVSIHIHDTEG